MVFVSSNNVFEAHFCAVVQNRTTVNFDRDMGDDSTGDNQNYN